MICVLKKKIYMTIQGGMTVSTCQDSYELEHVQKCKFSSYIYLEIGKNENKLNSPIEK